MWDWYRPLHCHLIQPRALAVEDSPIYPYPPSYAEPKRRLRDFPSQLSQHLVQSMAEALGLAANIIAIAGAATQLSIGLYEIASALKDAGPEVRVIANETSLFSRVLKEVSTVLEGNTAIAWRARSIAEDLVQVCQTVQQDGERLLQVLQPLVQQTGSQRQRLALRIRWLFQRSKFIYHRDTLGSLKLNLQLLISIMQMTREPQEQIYIRYVHRKFNPCTLCHQLTRRQL